VPATMEHMSKVNSARNKATSHPAQAGPWAGSLKIAPLVAPAESLNEPDDHEDETDDERYVDETAQRE
jgi:hypothetical protein